MKKFAAVCMSTLLVAGVTMGTVASAATVLDNTKKGSITLTKYEKLSDTQTSTDGANPVTGAEFTAYKVANITENGLFTSVDDYKDVSVQVGETTWSLDDLLTKDQFTANEGGLTYTDSDIFEKLIPGLQDVSKTDASGKTFTEGTAGTYTLSELDLGVYLVVETKVPANYTVASQSFLVALPTWNNTTGEWEYEVKASPKDAPVNPTKKIVGADDAKLDEDTVKIGDTVNFEVTANLPYYGDSLPTAWTEATVLYPTAGAFNAKVAEIKYILTDTMTKGLTFDNNMAVSVDGTALTKDTDFTVAYDTAANTVTANFDWSKINQYQGKKITVTYSATVNENAVIGSANTNTVKISYYNDPQTSDSTTDTDTDTTKVYTYGMDLTKTFNNAAADGTTINASTVEFTLADNAGKAFWFIKTADGNYTAYSPAMSGTTTEPAEGNVTVNGKEYKLTQKLNPTATGALSLKGLDVGTYVLTENKSVDGYSKLTSNVTIEVTGATTDGSLTGAVIAKIGEKTLANSADNDGIFTLSINNTKNQFNLPLTGGTGILLFTIGGGIVIAAAIIIFSQLRKKNTSAK